MCKEKILESIKRLNLDLSGTTVLTEAATGPYAVTPIIAALAGARVMAYSKSSRYGTFEEVKKETHSLANEFSGKHLDIEVISELTSEIIGSADIITNSGHLRPISSEMLRYVKDDVVIPLMYESWELRLDDIDIEYCNEHSIKTAGTNERHPDVDVFGYLGDMALKLIFDAGLTVHNNKFILICNNAFGPFISSTLAPICDGLAVCDLNENKSGYDKIDADWIGNFPNIQVPEQYKNASAVIVATFPLEKKWIGFDECPIDLSALNKEINNLTLLRFVGDVSDNDAKNGVTLYPKHVKSGHMGIIPSEIGFDPIIRLQSGGLKVAELMRKNEVTYNNIPLVQLNL